MYEGILFIDFGKIPDSTYLTGTTGFGAWGCGLGPRARPHDMRLRFFLLFKLWIRGVLGKPQLHDMISRPDRPAFFVTRPCALGWPKRSMNLFRERSQKEDNNIPNNLSDQLKDIVIMIKTIVEPAVADS